MSTFTCTYRGFAGQVLEFRKIMTDRTTTDAEISHAHKCLCLHYLGMEEEDKIETAAMILQATTSEAIRRGFNIDEDVLGETSPPHHRSSER